MTTSRKIDLLKIAFFYAIMAGIAWLWAYFAKIEWVFWGTKGLIWAYLFALMVFVISLQVSLKTQWAKKMEELFSSFLTPLSHSQIFVLSLASSIGEEMFFRGVLQNQFGIIPASLIFGLFHFPIEKILIPWTLSAIIMGFLLGGLYWHAGNLLAPVMLHFLINFLNLWAMNQKTMS